MLFCKSCSGFSLSLGLIKLWCTGWAGRAGQLGILESEQSACHCTRAHRLIQKYTPNEVTELRWKWLKCIVWAQKNCQQSLKIALLRSVKLGAIIQENDTSAYTDAAAHLSTRQLGEPGLGWNVWSFKGSFFIPCWHFFMASGFGGVVFVLYGGGHFQVHLHRCLHMPWGWGGVGKWGSPRAGSCLGKARDPCLGP